MLVCQPLVGSVVDVLMAYCTVWLPGLFWIVTTFTVMLLVVGVPLTVGSQLTAAPMPRSTTIVIEPMGVIACVAPDKSMTEMLLEKPRVKVPAIVGVPVIGTVTSVLLARSAVQAVSPGGKPETALASVIVLAYVPLDSVYIMLAPLTA